jgi:hypothetical protein
MALGDTVNQFYQPYFQLIVAEPEQHQIAEPGNAV